MALLFVFYDKDNGGDDNTFNKIWPCRGNEKNYVNGEYCQR